MYQLYLWISECTSSLVLYFWKLCRHIIVTRSDKKGSIARNYRCLINSLYFHFYVSYKNSVNISKISMNFYISVQIFSYHHVHRKSYKILNFENMVKIWPAISPFLSDRVTIIDPLFIYAMVIATKILSFWKLIQLILASSFMSKSLGHVCSVVIVQQHQKCRLC